MEYIYIYSIGTGEILQPKCNGGSTLTPIALLSLRSLMIVVYVFFNFDGTGNKFRRITESDENSRKVHISGYFNPKSSAQTISRRVEGGGWRPGCNVVW